MVLYVTPLDGSPWWQGGQSIHIVGNPSESSAGISGSQAFHSLACTPRLSGAAKTKLTFTYRRVPSAGAGSGQPQPS